MKTNTKQNLATKDRKSYRLFLRIFYVLLGPLISYPIINETGPLRFLGLSLLFSGYHLFMLVFKDLLPSVEEYLQTKVPNTRYGKSAQKTSKIIKPISIAIVLLFICTLTTIDKTIHGLTLLLFTCGTGVFWGILYIIWSIRTSNRLIHKSNIMGFSLGVILLTPMFISSFVFLSNRFIALKDFHKQAIKIESKVIGSGRKGKNIYYLYLKLDHKKERFTVGQAQFNAVKDSVYCDVHKGIFGYLFLDKIKPQP